MKTRKNPSFSIFGSTTTPIAAPDEIVSWYGLNDQAAIYSGTIDNTDRAIGRLVARLENSGARIHHCLRLRQRSYRPEATENYAPKRVSIRGRASRPASFTGRRNPGAGRGRAPVSSTSSHALRIDRHQETREGPSRRWTSPLSSWVGKFKRHQPLFWMTGANMVRNVDHTLFVSGTAKSPIDFKAANDLPSKSSKSSAMIWRKCWTEGGWDLRNRLFNIEIQPEADRLKNGFEFVLLQRSVDPRTQKSELAVSSNCMTIEGSRSAKQHQKNHLNVARMKKKAEANGERHGRCSNGSPGRTAAEEAEEMDRNGLPMDFDTIPRNSS